MKRKIFSKLLMVALVIAAVGSFVSCKDYDDDINNLQKQIDAKAALSELTALQSTLDSKIAAAQSAAQAAQATADAAATKTALADLKSALETAIADAKKAGTDAGTQAGQAITAANKAQETADAAAQAAKDADAAAKEALAEALKTIEETYETKAAAQEKADAAKEAIEAVKTIAEAAYTKAAAEELQKEVDDLKTSLEGLQTSLEADIDKKIDEKIKEVNNAVASVDAIWKAITSIQLFATYTGDEANITNITAAVGANLNFLHGQVKKNSLFGNNEDAQGEQGKPFMAFSNKDSIRVENGILVKIDPVNAQLTKDMLKLVDSEGNDLSDFVVFGEPKEYNTLITDTRAASKTGLWTVPVALKDNVTEEAFNKQVIVNYKANKATHEYKLYAVAVNNTETSGRDITTTYDLAAISGEYVPATALDFDVNTTNIAKIHNRWDGTNEQVVAEDGAVSIKNLEYTWLEATDDELEELGLEVPDTAIVANADGDKNAQLAGTTVLDDDRRGEDLLNVEKGVAFKVHGFDTRFVKAFYVVLDKGNAIESAPSEINAWNSYKYTGLNTMTSATESLSITIDEGSKDPSHDIIGFRVYAVNYDGTLVDPDGRAFYVQVDGAMPANNATIKSNATVEYTATSAVTATANASAEDVYYELVLPQGGFETLAGGAGTFVLEGDADDEYEDYLYGDVAVGYQLYEDNEGTAATNWKDAKYIRIESVSAPGLWKDTAKPLTYTIEGKNANGVVINSITLKMDKNLPTASNDGISEKAGALISGTTITLYPKPAPAAGATAAAPLGTVGATLDPLTATTWNTGTYYPWGVYDLSEALTFSDDYTWSVSVTGIKQTLKATAATAAPTLYKAENYVFDPATDGMLLNVAAIDRWIDNTGTTWKLGTARWTGAIGGSKTMNISRPYGNIATTDADGNEVDGGMQAYTPVVKTYTIAFGDPWKAQTSTLNKYQYVSSWTVSGANATPVWSESSSYVINYGANTMATEFTGVATASTVAGKGTALISANPSAAGGQYFRTNADVNNAFLGITAAQNDGSLMAMPAAAAFLTNFAHAFEVDPATFFQVSNTAYPNSNIFNGAFNAAYYVASLEIPTANTKAQAQAGATTGLVATEAYKIKATLSGTAADYYFVAPLAGGKFEIARYTDATPAIYNDLTGTVTLKMYSAFGNEITIGTFPFTVKP